VAAVIISLLFTSLALGAPSGPNENLPARFDGQPDQPVPESSGKVEKPIYYSISLNELKDAAAKNPNDGRILARLGEAYYGGWGGTFEFVEARKCFRQAADLNDPRGMAGLGWIYFLGQNTSPNSEQGVKWFRAGADKEDAWALYGLATAFNLGRGVSKRDPKAAADFRQRALAAYQKASEASDTEALG
jgi:TPR repeat protein